MVCINCLSFPTVVNHAKGGYYNRTINVHGLPFAKP
jgi:hypothetical protein